MAGSDSEIYDLKDLANEFDLSEVGTSPAIFDFTKLDYFNGYYIRQMDLGDLAKRAFPYLFKAGFVKKEDESILKVMALIQERLKKLSEIPELIEFFFKRPTYTAELLIAKGSTKEVTSKALEESVKVLAEENDFGQDSLESLLRGLAQKLEIKAGQVLWPIRVALSGQAASPGTFELLGYFGKDESLARMKIAVDMLK
jgi:glutamyl-tRNA synthetase